MNIQLQPKRPPLMLLHLFLNVRQKHDTEVMTANILLLPGTNAQAPVTKSYPVVIPSKAKQV